MNRTNKKNGKENTLLDPDVSSVFVVNNAKKRAFIEQFSHASVNFTQKDLGLILGFFIVRDNSPASENIVNFLASEVKKYYFSPTQKNTEEKFEATLHRLNRALEELANIGNVDWLGTIDGAVCVIADSSIYFSVTGNAHILLLREDNLLDISDGIASEDASQYPLKTFVDISSGDINAHDKIIITSPELLELVSFEELQKNAVRMGQKNFIQFIETVLTNECMIASTTIIDIIPLTQSVIAEPVFKEVPRNFFGAPREEKNTNQTTTEPMLDDMTQYIDEAATEDYTDPQTGHIYIQGATEPIEKPSFVDQFTEGAADLFDTIKEKTVKNKRLITKKISSMTPKKTANIEEFPFNNEEVANSTKPPLTADLKKKILPLLHKIKVLFNTTLHWCIDLFLMIVSKGRSLIKHPTKSITDPDVPYHEIKEREIGSSTSKKSFLPKITTITSLWRSMRPRTKLITLGIIIFIVIVPLFFSFSNKDTSTQETPTNDPIAQSPSTPQIPEASPATQQKPSISEPQNIYAENNILLITKVAETLLAAEKKGITIFDQDNSQKSFVLPADAGTIIDAEPMEDLDMLFIITDKDHIYSFSPLTKVFTKQESIPKFDHKKILHISTYMTYLYMTTDDKITRHTRIENGFDEGKEWLKEPVDLSKTTDMTISDSIYFADNGKVAAYTQGKKDAFASDSKITKAKLLYTSPQANHLWVLDTDKNILFQTDKNNGSVIKEFAHSQLENTTSFIVDEKNNTLYTSQSNGAFSYTLSK